MDSRLRGNDGTWDTLSPPSLPHPFPSFPRKRESTKDNALWETPYECGATAVR